MMPQDALLDQLKQRTVAEYASPPARAIAGALDLGILAFFQVVAAGVLGRLTATSPPPGIAGVDQPTSADFLFSPLLIIVLTALYFAGSWRLGGRTPAMRVLGLRVLNATDMSALTVSTALLRFVALVLALLPAGLGFFTAAGDARHQGWHDRVTGTVVVAE